MKNGYQPAYPTLDKLVTHGVDQGLEMKDPGMTKREMFAMAAMQGLLSNAPLVQSLGHHNLDHKNLVSISIGVAEELLKQLEE